MTNEQTAIMVDSYFEMVKEIERSLRCEKIEETEIVINNILCRIGGDISMLRGESAPFVEVRK